MLETKQKNKIRVAVVGCSRISDKHFKAIKSLKEMELVSICDSNQNTLSEHQIKYEANAYSDLEEMLEQEELDLVSICTPSGIHSPQAILCAKYGVNVLTEKPMATSWEDGLRMVDACNSAGLKLFVVKQYRQLETLKFLKRAIEEGRFGKINLVNLNVFWTRPQEYFDQAEWRGSAKMDGGAFMNQASHYVDLLYWLFGPVKEVNSYMSTSLDIETEDTGILNIKWENGALGSMNVTMLTYPKNFEASITVLGDKGTARIGGLAADEIQHWEFSEFKDYDADIEQVNKSTAEILAEGKGHNMYYQNIIDVFNGSQKAETDGDDGLRSLELLVALSRSADKNLSVALPLER
jgi:UDP-N-acetyl-2-amino-2-deoxyglucuronate dehydrogenase